MQISFSINDVSIRPVIQSVIKECDLVFILADSVFTKDHEWMRTETDIEKCVLLESGLNRSSWIVTYIQLRNEGGEYKNFRNYGQRELTELNTIYESLPKGIPLTLHSYASMVDNRKGITVTIPHEN